MEKISIITAQNVEIFIAAENNADYICLTDMVTRSANSFERNRYRKGFRKLEPHKND